MCITMLRDLFDAPARGSKGEGRQEVIGTKAEGQRLHQVHIVQFLYTQNPQHAITRANHSRVNFYYSNVDTVQKKYREKPRF